MILGRKFVIYLENNPKENINKLAETQTEPIYNPNMIVICESSLHH